MKQFKSILISLPYIYIYICLINFSNLYSQNPLKTITIDGQQITIATNELCVKLKNGVSDQTLQNYIAQYGGIIQNRYSNSFSKWRLITFPSNVQVENLFSTFKSNSLFEYVEYNYAGFPQSEWIPNDPLFNQQWHLKNTGQTGGTVGADIKATQAWEITRGNPDVVIAILDSGIPMIKGTNTLSHPDLDDPNKIILGIDVTNSPDGLRDSSGHGTHVAGIAGAETNNFTGVSGVCPDCKMLIIKISRIYKLDTPQDTIYYYLAFDFYDAINYLIKFKSLHPDLKIIYNFSLGMPLKSIILEEAINLAEINGFLGVTAAGNLYKFDYYPAAYSKKYSSIIAVTSVDDKFMADPLYSKGDYINLSAPGKNILSTKPNYPVIYDTSLSFYKIMTGTSMAAPIVSGIAGLILSISDYEPNLVREILEKSTNRINTYDTIYGWGIVDAVKALNKIKSRPLNCRVVNFNGKPKIIWDQNPYSDTSLYNCYLIYKSIISSTENSKYYIIDTIEDLNQLYYIDYTETICNNNCENGKLIKYRVSKAYINYTIILETGKSNAASIRTSGYSLEKQTTKNNFTSDHLKFFIYPNPFNSLLNLEVTSENNSYLHISIYNIMGEFIQSEMHFIRKGNNKISINFSNLPSGNYILSLENEGKISNKIITLIK